LNAAADAYQKVGFLTLNFKKDPQAAYQCLTKAVNLFKIHGNTLKAQEMLKKLGKRCFDQGYEELGVRIYQDILDEVFEGENYGTGAEVITEYVNFLIDKGKFPEAIDAYSRHIKYLLSVKKYEHLVARAWLGIICIHIVMGEHYIAEDKLTLFGSQISKPMSSDEYRAVLNLTDAIHKGDEVLFAKTLKQPIFGQIEAALLKRLKKYVIPKKEMAKKEDPLFGNVETRKKQKEEKKTEAKPTAPLEEEKVPKGTEEAKTVVRKDEEEKAAPAVPANPDQKAEGEVKPEEPKPAEAEKDFGGAFT